jgi:hypothetical protein
VELQPLHLLRRCLAAKETATRDRVCRVNTVCFDFTGVLDPESRVQGPYRVGSDGIGSLGPTVVIDSANGAPQAGLGPQGAGQSGRACMATRLAMTALSGEWGRSGWAKGPIGPSELNQARWPADLLIRAAGLGERGRPGRLTRR